jgi:hypothetical protein
MTTWTDENCCDQRLLDALDGIAYVIDRDRRIISVGLPNWLEFARENGGERTCAPERVLGRDLLSFVAGDEVRALYGRLIERTFSGRSPGVVLPAACDSPGVGRENRLSLRPIRLGARPVALLFQSLILNERQRPPINMFDFAALRAAMEEHSLRPMIKMCSLCQRVQTAETSLGEPPAWIDAESYYRSGGCGDVRISHGICPPCASKCV